MKPNLYEEQLQSDKIFSGDFIELYRDKVKLPDNNTATREYLKHSGAACVIAINEHDEVIVEYQYRYPVRQVILELPAGKIDKDESQLECAKRELEEETGYTAQQWIFLGECLPCIAYSTEVISYFLARDLVKKQAKLDEGEFIEVATMKMSELVEKAYHGEIKDSKTLSGIMLYLGYLNKN
jgi:ADP-ribose pyrophosphatase